MKMKIVNPHFVRRLLDPFLALSDEEVTELMKINPSNEEAVKKLLKALIVPEYSRYGPKSKQICKDSLKYLLSTENTLFDKILSSATDHLFDLPQEPRSFFVWLWQELFGEEDFSLIDKENYVVQNDEHAPNLAHIL